MSSSPLTGALWLVPLAALAAWLYPTVESHVQLRKFEPAIALSRWADHPQLNNEHCVVHNEAHACEDVKVHFGSSTAFIACGDAEIRKSWYPPGSVRNAAARSEDSFRETLFKYDIKAKKTTQLHLEGLAGDLITHGIEVYSFPDDLTKVHIFLVNHRRDGESIEIFSHVLGTDSAQLVKSVRHAAIKTPNGVAASGPMTFYTTNDHYFYGGPFRDFEDKYGPWPGATDVQHCDASGEIVQCRQVSDRRPGYNGIAISPDGQQLFVGDCRIGQLNIFNITSANGLARWKTVELGAPADNIRVNPETGDPIAAVFPKPLDLALLFSNPEKLGHEILVPSAALQLMSKNNYEPEVVFYDDGSHLSFMTAGTIDPYNKVFLGAAILQEGGFAVCDLGKRA